MRRAGHELQRIKVDAQGYDASGAYWGAGPDVFIATRDNGNDQVTVRARNLREARQKIDAELRRAPDAAPAGRDPLGGNAPRKTRYEFDWTDPAGGSVIRIRVTHARDYLASGSDHLETESLRPKKAPLPITETGYRSHFITPLELMNAGGPVTFVRSWLDREAAGNGWTRAATAKAQGDLFSWADAHGEVGRKRGTDTKPSPAGKTSVQTRRPDGAPSRRQRPKRDPT